MRGTKTVSVEDKVTNIDAQRLPNPNLKKRTEIDDNVKNGRVLRHNRLKR